MIKKEMVKDGHLVSPHVYYVRERDGFMVWDQCYQIRDLVKDLRERGHVTLRIEGTWHPSGSEKRM